MPKILIVFYSGDDVTGAIADAVAAGAESVRFSEVEVRRVGDAPAHVSASKTRRTLDPDDALATYDAIIVGGPTAEGLAAPLASLLDGAAASHRRADLADKVGSAFTGTPAATGELAAAPIMARLAALGMILVPPVASGGAESELDRARAMGRRVAQVTAWVTHSLAHERGHAHEHGAPPEHDHGHSHTHSHGHEHGHSHEHSHGPSSAHEHGHSHEPGRPKGH